MNFHEQAMNCIDPTKFIKIHYCSWNSSYERHELNHEHIGLFIFMIFHELAWWTID